MAYFGGDLSDVVRGGAAAAPEVPDWQSTIDLNPHEYYSDDFGDPFVHMRDTDADTPHLSGFFKYCPNVIDKQADDQSDELRRQNLGGKILDDGMKRPFDAFSRMLGISLPDAKLPFSPVGFPAAAAVTDSSNTFVSSNGSGIIADCSTDPQYTGMRRRKNMGKKVICIPAPAPAPALAPNTRQSGEAVPSDLWAWRKYGQKPIKGSPYPRGYYRCSSSKGCTARKQVERSRTDPNMLVITYTSDHNHPWPTHRNALAGSTRPPSSQPPNSKKPPNSTAEKPSGDHQETTTENAAAEDDDHFRIHSWTDHHRNNNSPPNLIMMKNELDVDFIPARPLPGRRGSSDQLYAELEKVDIGGNVNHSVVTHGGSDGISRENEGFEFDPFIFLCDWTAAKDDSRSADAAAAAAFYGSGRPSPSGISKHHENAKQ